MIINNHTFIGDLQVGDTVGEHSPYGSYRSKVTEINLTNGVITVERPTGTLAHYNQAGFIINYKDVNGQWTVVEPANAFLWNLEQLTFSTADSPFEKKGVTTPAVPIDGTDLVVEPTK